MSKTRIGSMGGWYQRTNVVVAIAVVILSLGGGAEVHGAGRGEVLVAQAPTSVPASVPPPDDPMLPEAQREAKRLEDATRAGTDGTSCRPKSGRDIYYGEPTNEKATVALTFFEGGQRQLCSGVVVGEGAVLTAGHCSCGDNYTLWFGREADVGPSLKIARDQVVSYRGRYGRYDCRRTRAPQAGFDYGLIKFNPAELALVDGEKSKPRIAKVMPPIVARQSRLDRGTGLRVVGYGLTEDDRTLGTKLGATIPVASWECSEPWADSHGCQSFSEIILAARPTGGRRGPARDSCGGDSGGPAFAVVAETDDCGLIHPTYYLVAITSRGTALRSDESTGKRCGGGGVYEVVARQPVIEWLRSNGINIDLQLKPPGE